jgi:hypothetical protein
MISVGRKGWKVAEMLIERRRKRGNRRNGWESGGEVAG